MDLEAVDNYAATDQEWEQFRDYEISWNSRTLHTPKNSKKIQDIVAPNLESLSQHDKAPPLLERNIFQMHLEESDNIDDAEFFDPSLFSLPHPLSTDNSFPQPHLLSSRKVYEISFQPGRVVINNGKNRFDAFICQKHKKKGIWHKCKDGFKKTAKKVGHAVKKTAKEVGKAVEKAAHEVKEFVVEHKTEIIVVAAVVVGVAVVAGVVIAASAVAAETVAGTAAAAAAVATAAPRKKEEEEQASIPISNISPSIPSIPPTENYAGHSSIEVNDFMTLPTNNPFARSEAPQITLPPGFPSLPPQPSKNPPPSFTSSGNLNTLTFSNISAPQSPSSDSQKNNTSSFAFVDPDGPVRIYDNTPTPSPSSDTKKNNSSFFAFVDPDGPVRVYDNTPTSSPSSDTPKSNPSFFAFVDPDGPVRVYDNIPTPSLSSDTPKDNPPFFGFFDPDGPIRIYTNPPISDNSLSVGSQESPFPRTTPPFAALDLDGPLRVYNIPNPEFSRSKAFEIPGIQLARGAIGGINGIGNSIEDAQFHANYLAKISGNHNVHWVYNSSHSAVVDVAETIFLNYQGVSAPAKLLQEKWMQFHEQHKNDPEAKFLQFCHSQGTAHVRNALLEAPQEIRDRIIVVAIAPSVIVPDDLCFRSFNYASKRDPIPYAEVALYAASDDPFIRELAQQKQELLKQLILLDPHPDAPLLDHGMESPTFVPVINERLEEFFEKYERLK